MKADAESGGDRDVLVPLALSVAAGLLLWLMAAEFGGRREAWDSPLYWLGAYPLALLICALLGYGFPGRPKLWAFALFAAQFAGMVLRSEEISGLLPLGLVAFAVIALPGAVLGCIGASRR